MRTIGVDFEMWNRRRISGSIDAIQRQIAQKLLAQACLPSTSGFLPCTAGDIENKGLSFRLLLSIQKSGFYWAIGFNIFQFFLQDNFIARFQQ